MMFNCASLIGKMWQFFFPEPEVFLSISRCTQSLVFSRWIPLPCIEVSAIEQRSLSTSNQRILGGPFCLQLLWAEFWATFPANAPEKTIHCDANYGDVTMEKKNKWMPLSDRRWGFTLMLSLLSLFFSKVTTSSRMMWSKVNYLLLVYVLVAVLDSFLLWMVSYSIWVFVGLQTSFEASELFTTCKASVSSSSNIKTLKGLLDRKPCDRPEFGAPAEYGTCCQKWHPEPFSIHAHSLLVTSL